MLFWKFAAFFTCDFDIKLQLTSNLNVYFDLDSLNVSY